MLSRGMFPVSHAQVSKVRRAPQRLIALLTMGCFDRILFVHLVFYFLKGIVA